MVMNQLCPESISIGLVILRSLNLLCIEKHDICVDIWKKRRATFGTGETLQYSFKSEVEIHCDRRGRDLHNPDAGHDYLV